MGIVYLTEMINDMSLSTKRLIVREFNENDWQAVHEYSSDPQVVRFMSWGPNTEEETQAFVRRVVASQAAKPRIRYEFAVILRSKDRLIGNCCLLISSPSHREGWISYVFNPRFWGERYASEAAKILLRFGFTKSKLHRIFALCDPENMASRRILEKIGMQQEGYLRKNLLIKGRWHDSFLYAILEDEWNTQQNNSSP